MERVEPRSSDATSKGRTAVIIIIMMLIVLAHVFRVGAYLPDPLFTIYYSYFSDIVIPLGMYLLLCLNDVFVRIHRDWRVKAFLVFGVASFTEVLQALGVPLLGQTFDPLDFLMFGAGVLLAVFVDKAILDRIFPRRIQKV